VQTAVLDEHQAEEKDVHSAVFDEHQDLECQVQQTGVYLNQSAIRTRTQQGLHDQ
jgi:hypothetical protein